MTHRTRPRRATFVLAAAVGFPLVPWLLAGSVEDRFSGIEILKSVGNLTAFFAVAAWAANLFLATRLGAVERAFGGLEHLYLVHRRLGVLVVAFALAHVLFLSLYEGADALDLYLPSAGLATFSGVIALVMLIGLVGASLVRRLAYQSFVVVQRLLGAAFAVGAFHSFAVRGTAAASPLLAVYLACLTALGLVSFGYRLAGGRSKRTRRPYRVAEAHRLGDDVIEIVLSPVASPLAFAAGQFVYVTFQQDGIPRESHPFTIASAPGDELRIVVKRLGDFTSRVMGLRPGAGAQVEGPFGSFSLHPDPINSQTWIAGGIGITPFLSWARSLDRALPIDLYYCTPGAEQAHFIESLYEIADRFPRFRVVPIRKSSLGHLDVEDIAAINPNVASGHVFICGPQEMIENMTRGFEARGVPPHRIHSEEFDFRR